MLTNSKIVIVVISVFLFSMLGCRLANIAQTGAEGKAPIRQLRILIDVNRHDELVGKFREFAEEHDFTILVRSVDVIPDGLFVEMYRDDLIISALTVPDVPTKIDLGFYERNPSQPTPEETVNTLFNDLLDRIHEIPNVTVSEVK